MRGSGEYFRPSLWPVTPDIPDRGTTSRRQAIFHDQNDIGATLAATYGIYGPVFQLCETDREPRSEEYLDSEKYEIRHWAIDRPESLGGLIARLNQIRRENRALQSDRNLRFYPTDNEEIICYSKHAAEDFSDIVLMVVNLDPRHKQSGWIELPISELGLEPDKPYQVHDL